MTLVPRNKHQADCSLSSVSRDCPKTVNRPLWPLYGRESLRPLVPDDVRYSHSVNRTAIIGEWGDNINLNVMGIIWDINIAVLGPNGEGGYVWDRVYEGVREGC